MGSSRKFSSKGNPMELVPNDEALMADMALCCQMAKLAYNSWKTLPRSRDVQQYWNRRACAARELLSTDKYMQVEDEQLWDTRGAMGNGMPIRNDA